MKLTHLLAAASAASLLLLGTGTATAQDRGGRGDRGGFDPEQMRQRMNERIREQLDVKGDAEWKIIEERLGKVMEARREASSGGRGFGMMFGRGGPGGPGGDRGGDRRPGSEASPEVDALQKAIEAKAPAEEIKAKLAKFREARKANEAKLAKAREELRQVLTVRQEAVMVMMGMLE